jgi:hypothetical protein
MMIVVVNVMRAANGVTGNRLGGDSTPDTKASAGWQRTSAG